MEEKKVSRFEKHLGKTNPININGEDFYLEPLGVSELWLLTEYSEISEKIQVYKPEVSKAPQELKDKLSNIITKLIYDTLDISYPNEDKKIMYAFGDKYAFKLLPKIMEINTPDTKSKTAKDKINQFVKARGQQT